MAGLIQLGDGFLYGTTSQTLAQGGTVFKVAADGSGYQVIKAFGTSGTDALGPMAGLILGGDGFLYGTTNGGGANSGGTVFKIAPDGANFLIIKSFQCGNNAANGCSPQAGLILLSDGFLYGTTTSAEPTIKAPSSRSRRMVAAFRSCTRFSAVISRLTAVIPGLGSSY